MDSTIFYTGPLDELVKSLKVQEGKTIFFDDGAEVVNALLQQHLLNENILSIISILLGNGTRLFKDDVSEQLMTLVSIRAYDTDLAQLHYRKKEE